MNNFGFTTTADEVLAGVSLTGRRALVTGATSGVGAETARALAAHGAAVVLGVRNVDAGRRLAAELSGDVTVGQLDLSDLDSVRSFTAAWDGPLDLLINNAGIMATPELTRTKQGHELQFAVNYLGHFALTAGLHSALARSGRSRIVSLSSNAHLFAPFSFDDYDYLFRPYQPLGAYGESKTATVLLAVEADRRWGCDGIRANAVHPGAIATNLQQHTGGLQTPVERRKTVAQGAATSVFAAVADVGGRYFEDCGEAVVLAERPPLFGGGVAPFALSLTNAERLWELGEQLVATV
ncbi:SDR family NAD(P)-dependent oxidoreductase [Kribbella italica]|uniref:NAD(P)-dependent dehydrogenase (Short-subunit alcohol dehydrogenase family) n=1 Tax=Kribbella italica TaxID=1540520 RepID=A0A7W9JC95_9ACTN|nr:SDR family NAD(P)-dependent oxidoreductase [Kribbella italica]MBB5839496.1 NAD(P)-dependent dehydrogenase (short-subunit alcohol dehydrogenase family) [Kribbella italica]